LRNQSQSLRDQSQSRLQSPKILTQPTDWGAKPTFLKLFTPFSLSQPPFSVNHLTLWFSEFGLSVVSKLNWFSDKPNWLSHKVNSLFDKLNSFSDKLNSCSDKVKWLFHKVKSLFDKLNSLPDKTNWLAHKLKSFSDKLGLLPDKLNSLAHKPALLAGKLAINRRLRAPKVGDGKVVINP